MRALQGDPENSGNFKAYCLTILGILGITRILKFPEFSGSPGFRVSGFYGLGFRVLGVNRNCIGFVSGVLLCFGVLFLAFAVLVWVLSGVVGGVWFWGAEGLGLRLWGWG